MVATLERRLVGAPKTTYKPADGYERFLGNQPIKIIELNEPILDSSSRIKRLQVLRLEDKIDSENKDGLIRKVALLEDKEGHIAAVYFYQDNFDPKREDEPGNVSHNLFGDIATVGQIKVISSVSEKNKNRDLFFDADQMAREQVANSKMRGLKDNDTIRISGSGTVIVTDLNLNSFIEATELQQAVGELFKVNGIFKNNIVVPSVNNKTLVANMEEAGAQVLYKTTNFPNVLGLFLDIVSESKLDFNSIDSRKFYDRLMPLITYIPYFEKLYKDKEVQMKYRDITEYMKKQLLPLIKQIHSGLTI